MSRADGPVKVYQHELIVWRIFLLSDQDRCVTLGRDDVKMFSLRSNRHLMDFELAGEGINHAALLNDEILAGILDSAELCFWSLSTGKILQRIKEQALEDLLTDEEYSGVNGIFAFCDDRFMVMGEQRRRFGARVKAVLFDLETDSTIYGPEQSIVLKVSAVCTSFGGLFDDIFACQNRFVKTGPGKTAQVWTVESGKFRRLKVLRPGYSVGAVSLDDQHIIVGPENGYDVGVYDANTFDFIRTIASPFSFPAFLPISSDWLLFVYSLEEERVLGLDIRQGTEVWSVEFDGVLHVNVSVSDEPQVIFATIYREVLTCHLPEDIASEVKKSSSFVQSAVSHLPPLQAALSSCLSGHSSPADHCNTLINYSSCRESFAEWCSAHQILVLAAQNGEVKKTTEHEGSISHWFENLYLAVKDVELTSEEDNLMAKRYLDEARRLGIIEGIEGVLSALHVTKALNEEVRALQHAGLRIFELVMRVEKRLDALRESCKRYRKYQMYSQCIGIALQVIPIVGGASAGVISAGANIVEGLSIKDVADYAFGLGDSLAEGEISSLGDRVLGRAADALSPECIAKMEQEQLRRFEEAVSVCGLNVEQLRELFKERSSSRSTWLVEEISTVPESDENYPANANISEVAKEVFADTEEEPQEAKRLKGVAGMIPSELKDVGLTAVWVETLEQIEIATLWAAFIVRFDDSRMEMFSSLRYRIFRVLDDSLLDGPLLVDRNVISENEVAKTVVDGLMNDGRGELTAVVRAKVKQLLTKIKY